MCKWAKSRPPVLLARAARRCFSSAEAWSCCLQHHLLPRQSLGVFQGHTDPWLTSWLTWLHALEDMFCLSQDCVNLFITSPHTAYPSCATFLGRSSWESPFDLSIGDSHPWVKISLIIHQHFKVATHLPSQPVLISLDFKAQTQRLTFVDPKNTLESLFPGIAPQLFDLENKQEKSPQPRRPGHEDPTGWAQSIPPSLPFFCGCVGSSLLPEGFL